MNDTTSGLTPAVIDVTPIDTLIDAFSRLGGILPGNRSLYQWGRYNDPLYPEGRFTPPGITYNAPVLSASSGITHTCLVTEDNVGMCEGVNVYGEVGSADHPIGTRAVGSFVNVTGLPPVTYITCGYFYSCALLVNGDVWCWGFNSAGGLGLGDDCPEYSACSDPNTNIAQKVLNVLPPINQLSGKFSHVCGSTKAGQVWCWGSDNYGELGRGNIPESTSSTPGIAVEFEPYVALEVRTGLQLTCIISSEYQVLCLGQNGNGMVNGVSGPVVYSPVQVPLYANAISISCSQLNSCAALANNQVWCWGYDLYGSLGDVSDENPRLFLHA